MSEHVRRCICCGVGVRTIRGEVPPSWAELPGGGHLCQDCRERWERFAVGRAWLKGHISGRFAYSPLERCPYDPADSGLLRAWCEGYSQGRIEKALEPVMRALRDELMRAREQHPRWPRDVIHQAAIVQEEAGELIQAALDVTYDGASRSRLREEAVQVGAMALRFLAHLEE